MRKNVLALALFAASTTIATSAMADVHFDFGVPFAVTKAAGFSSPSGYSTSLTIDIDSTTALGLYNEVQNYSDTAVLPAGAPGTATITAFRFQKSVTEVVGVGIDLGSITTATTGVVTAGAGSMADIFGNAKLLSTKGKVNSYLSAEMKYRLATTANANALAANNFGGLQFGLSAGLNF